MASMTSSQPVPEGAGRRRRPRRPGLVWLLVALVLPIAAVALGSATLLLLHDGAEPETVAELAGLEELAGERTAIGCEDCLSQARAELGERRGDLGYQAALGVALDTDLPEAWGLVIEAGLLGGELSAAEAEVVLGGLERFYPEHDVWRSRATLALVEGRPTVTWMELERQQLGLVGERLEADVMLELGRWSELEELTRARLSDDPTDVQAVLQLSRALEAQGRPRQAERVLVRALESGISAPGLIEASAALAWRDGRAEVAHRRLAALGQSRPEALAWQALSEGRAEDALALAERAGVAGELAGACAMLALDRRNEVIELAGRHRGQAPWDLLAARAQQGLPEADGAWRHASSHNVADIWRQRLAATPSSQLAAALDELEAVDPVLALLQRGPDEPSAPGTLLAPASWEEVIERTPASRQALVRWWAGLPVTRGPERLRGLSAVEQGQGDLAWSLLRSDPDPVLRGLARHAQGRGSLAQAELVPELDPLDPVHVAVLGLICARRGDPRPGARMLGLALDLEPGWRGLYEPRYRAALAAEAADQP